MDENLDPEPGPSDAGRASDCKNRNRGLKLTANQNDTKAVDNWRRKGGGDIPLRSQSFWGKEPRLQASNQNSRRGGFVPRRGTTAKDSRNLSFSQPRGSHSRKSYKTMSNFDRDKKRMEPDNEKLDLKAIAQSESQDVLQKLTEHKEQFKKVLESSIEELDLFVLIIKCMAKISQSSFDVLKLKLLRETCNSKFIGSLKSYLLELPYTTDKSNNEMYWKQQDIFWRNLVTFLESIINTSPSLAFSKCRSLVDATTDTCLKGLEEKHSYNLPEMYVTKITELREKMNNFEKVKESGTTLRKQLNTDDDTAPPENFRELSILPTTNDLLETQNFLRPNIVDGAYKDVGHYLDVQFRLLREDCYGPLREGLSQYKENPNRRKYDNIRVIHNVKFVKPYVSLTKIGSVVQLDMKTNRHFRKINWRNSKRFIYGSLVLFTKDNCNSFLVATILDRELKLLRNGLIPVSLMDIEIYEQLYNDDLYTMIESEVYFEPYYHVLRALQDYSICHNLPMQQYIVHVNPDPKPPAYLKPETKFTVSSVSERKQSSIVPSSDSESDSEDVKMFRELFGTLTSSFRSSLTFTVLDVKTWPGKDSLEFNESQFEAYKLALTHELALIQGPPGTGKTYLGIKVAETLYDNMKASHNGCLMLVICYTNHALDQFLEALLKITPSVARIGGQSQNKAMEPINLTNLRRLKLARTRKQKSSASYVEQMYYDSKSELREIVGRFQQETVELDVLLNGVIKCHRLDDIPEVAMLRKNSIFPKGQQDVLFLWLFEHIKDYYTDFKILEEDEYSNKPDIEFIMEARDRIGVDLDDLNFTESRQSYFLAAYSSFSLEATNNKLRGLVAEHRACEDSVKLYALKLMINTLNAQKALFTDMSQYRENRIDIQITENTNFHNFTPAERWTLYFSWINEEVQNKKQKIGNIQHEVNYAIEMYEEARTMLDVQILRQTTIVGMTTTGAARVRKLLQTLAPPIVIVEEAAEVLEQHIVTSLNRQCQHLILIGDHQQLRPSAAYMKLARHYQIEVSLFERMVTNGIHSRRLGVQHRMRPEIAALICPHIYADLQNHPSVDNLPNVKGLSKNMFFFSHDHKEEETENTTRTNHKEADLVLELANYLIKQGYNNNDVTILSAYQGQMFYLKEESKKYINLHGVRITVVDNYQGEESKIILLSLVRNNDNKIIGFLGTPNRICVALSRAKEGFYIFGNIDILKSKSELWRNIATTLEENNSVGSSIPLKCENHPGTVTVISDVDDFKQVPEGGCMVQCNFIRQKCGHPCQLFCHVFDPEHKTDKTACPRQCERILCSLGHVCPKQCAYECGPCMHPMRKTLPCGHEQNVSCHLEPNNPKVECLTKVDVTLPDCGHQIKKKCSEDVKYVKCSVKCGKRIEKCGHDCVLHCHVKKDPDHKKYICQKKCSKAKQGCATALEGDRGDHQCWKLCYEPCDVCTAQVYKRRSTCTHTERIPCSRNIDDTPCKKNCARKLPCDHFCKKKCSDACGDCMEMVTKEIPDCKHKVKLMCKKEPVRALCTQNCERTMTCGHKCTGICGIECDPTLCTEPTDHKAVAPCGHHVYLPCNVANLTDKRDLEMLAASCAVACHAELACGHVCGGTCARCRRGALHAPCTQPCHQINICEHQCDAPCNQICPPCKKPCEVKCKHLRCRNPCGDRCTPCQEPCSRMCEHGGACRKRCGEACSRGPCDEACALRLPCGHPCRGLCGEPCPPVCRACDPDRFPTDFLGDDFDDDAKFVFLKDCGHVIEAQAMDSIMFGDGVKVEMRKCPKCRKPIINTNRYKDHYNKIFKEEINPIKTRIYGTPDQIKEKKTELAQKIQAFRQKYFNVITANKYIKTVYLNLQNISKTTKPISKAHLAMESTCLEILDVIADCYNKYLESNLTELKKELTKQTDLLCGVFVFKLNAGVMLKVTEQEQKDLVHEIKRMNSIVQLAKLVGHVTYASSKNDAKVQAEFEVARAAVFSWTVFDENKTMQALKSFEETMKISGVVTKQERNIIVKAIAVKAGHWYKCPNAHFYCVENGGSNMEIYCPVCSAAIENRNDTTV